MLGENSFFRIKENMKHFWGEYLGLLSRKKQLSAYLASSNETREIHCCHHQSLPLRRVIFFADLTQKLYQNTEIQDTYAQAYVHHRGSTHRIQEFLLLQVLILQPLRFHVLHLGLLLQHMPALVRVDVAGALVNAAKRRRLPKFHLHCDGATLMSHY